MGMAHQRLPVVEMATGSAAGRRSLARGVTAGGAVLVAAGNDLYRLGVTGLASVMP